MTGNIRSALVAGVIYTVIAMLTGQGFGAAVGVGLVFLVGTAVITFIITQVLVAVRKRSAH